MEEAPQEAIGTFWLWMTGKEDKGLAVRVCSGGGLRRRAFSEAFSMT